MPPRWESTVTDLVEPLPWVFLVLQPLLRDSFTPAPSPNSPNGDKENQRPSSHWACGRSARAVVDIKSQNTLLWTTYYVPLHLIHEFNKYFGPIMCQEQVWEGSHAQNYVPVLMGLMCE